ncbi:MAG: cache domain-containing protein [Rhodospirillales bacterium]|nr:cache domain-containing protein [Rhodospirillales bacterium]
MFLDKLKIGSRLLLIVAGTVIGIAGVGGYSLKEIRANLFEDRQIKTEHVVHVVETLLEYYQSLEKSGAVTREAAQKMALAAVGSLRYDHGKEYFWIQSYDNVMLLHPIQPEMNGKSLNGVTDPNGIKFFEEMVAAAKKDGDGDIEYMWPKPGSKAPVQKISYVKAFAPWQWIVGSGIYIDDVDAIFMDVLTVVGGVALVILLLVGGGSIVISRGITKPLTYIATNMQRLAEGDKSIKVQFTDQKNEIGDLSRSMDVFLEKTIEMERMREEQVETERRTEEEKRQAMLKLADAFENSVGHVVNQVSSAATEMQSSSEAMGATAEETTRQAAAVAAASEQASANVQTVASASEELASSISEISRQVTQASQIASAAVTEAERANVKVQGLAQAANKIGEVVALITDIAEQTNLLALNATIEAARAGDAGKGFAVVASEVKNLANQTAKATDEIGAQITGIQSATREAVAAIEEITKTISKINEVNSGVASAVEEQGAATQEIARNVEQAAAGTQEVSNNISGVSSAANDTGAAAIQIQSTAADLSRQSETLRAEVDKFLANVRAA